MGSLPESNKSMAIGRNGVFNSDDKCWYWADWMSGCKGEQVYLTQDNHSKEMVVVFRKSDHVIMGTATRVNKISVPSFKKTFTNENEFLLDLAIDPTRIAGVFVFNEDVFGNDIKGATIFFRKDISQDRALTIVEDLEIFDKLFNALQILLTDFGFVTIGKEIIVHPSVVVGIYKIDDDEDGYEFFLEGETGISRIAIGGITPEESHQFIELIGQKKSLFKIKL